jgi:hypothetical protein
VQTSANWALEMPQVPLAKIRGLGTNYSEKEKMQRKSQAVWQSARRLRRASEISEETFLFKKKLNSSELQNSRKLQGFS